MSATSTQTCNCSNGEHTACLGYIAPLVHSDTRPCNCDCHSMTNPHNFQASMERAKRSYYGEKIAAQRER